MKLKLIVLSAIGLLSQVAMAVSNPNFEGKHFGDWGGACDDKLCYLQQVLSQNDQPLMVTAIGHPEENQFATVLIQLPANIQIKQGVLLQVDNNPSIKFNGRCDKDSCIAGFALDETMLKQFNQGKKALVSFVPGPKKEPVSLPISMKGLKAGLAALEAG